LRIDQKDWGVLRDVAKLLKYFVKEHKYRYIDSLANAYNPKVAELILREALREAKSAKDQGADVYLPSEDSLIRFIEMISEDLSVTGIVAALSLTGGG